MPEKTPGEPNLSSKIYQPAKISYIMLVIKYPYLDHPN